MHHTRPCNKVAARLIRSHTGMDLSADAGCVHLEFGPEERPACQQVAEDPFSRRKPYWNRFLRKTGPHHQLAVSDAADPWAVLFSTRKGVDPERFRHGAPVARKGTP